jgi:hypothetical protein
MNAPPGKVPVYCEKYCLHGEIDPISWTSSDPTPCVCSGTGFITYDFRTGIQDNRCGIPKCKNDAPYDPVLDACLCPFLNMSSIDCMYFHLIEEGDTTASSSDPWKLPDGRNAKITVIVIPVSFFVIGLFFYLMKVLKSPSVKYTDLRKKPKPNTIK